MGISGCRIALIGGHLCSVLTGLTSWRTKADRWWLSDILEQLFCYVCSWPVRHSLSSAYFVARCGECETGSTLFLTSVAPDNISVSVTESFSVLYSLVSLEISENIVYNGASVVSVFSITCYRRAFGKFSPLSFII